MWRTNLRLAFRHLTKQKTISLINILGLASGLIAFLLIVQHVSYEWSFDHFHTDADRIFRVDSEFASDGLRERYASNYYGVPEALTNDFPEVESYVTLHAVELLFETQGQVLVDDGVFMVDSNFLQFFSFPVIAGDAATALREPASVALSATAAKRYFGEGDPIGKVLRYNDGNELNVKAVVEIPDNSHFKFNAVINNARFVQNNYRKEDALWSWSNFWAYVKLTPGANMATTQAKIPALITKYIPDDTEETACYLVPITDIHLESNLEDELDANGNKSMVWLLLVVALAIMTIGWVNYINLATAQATERAKEVGVRKVVGAQRSQLVGQFFTHAVVTNLIAVVAAGLMLLVGKSFFSGLLGHTIEFSIVPTQLLLAFGGFLVGGIIISGIYPAFLISAVQPMQVLKGQLTAKLSGMWARRGLTVFQFVASIILIAGTFAVYQQVSFMQQQDLGFVSDQMLVVHGPKVGPDDYGSAYRPMRASLQNLPEVDAFCGAGTIPTKGYSATLASVRRSGVPEQEGLLLDFVIADEDYLSTFNVPLIAGRTFSPTRDSAYRTVIINESASHKLGFATPEDALGKVILWSSEDVASKWRKIVGVAKDYHHMSLARAKDALVILYNDTPDNYFTMRINTGDVGATIGKIKGVYDQFFPGNAFDHFFIDEAFNAQYEADIRLGNIMSLFGGLTIFIACLGLFGLASFTALRKMKEMGIRKVLGASFQNIVYLFTKEFLLLIAIANLIGLPMAYWLIQRWLSNYAYTMPISATLFLVPAVLLLLIAATTISYHTLRTVWVNPVEHLRQE